MHRRPFRLRDLRLVARSDPARVPTAVGQVVQVNSGSPWCLVLAISGPQPRLGGRWDDFIGGETLPNDGMCTVGYKQHDGSVYEFTVPTACLHRV